MDYSTSSKISNESSFQLFGNSVNNVPHQNTISILSSLTESLNRNLSESVFDFMKCFICLGKASQPLSCPKCNNFACKKCLQTYFNGEKTKSCPLCKQTINFDDMKESEVIKKIENILNRDTSKKDKFEKLIELIKEKTDLWKNENNSINSIIERILKYQEILHDYKKEYDLFFLNCQKAVEKTFNDFSKKIEELINSLLAQNKVGVESIQRYNNINKNYQNNINNDIKDIINEILSMERKHFNEINHNETESFSFLSFKIIPSLLNVKIRDIKLKSEDFDKYSAINIKGNCNKLGDYKIKYSFDFKNGFKALCQLSFTVKEDSNNYFLITQSRIKKYKQKLFPMRLVENKNNQLHYECLIPFDEYNINNKEDIDMILEALVFTLN